MLQGQDWAMRRAILGSIFGPHVVNPPSGPPLHQISEVTLDRLETAAAATRSPDGAKCSICLGGYDDGGEGGEEAEGGASIQIKLDCGHVFHRVCGAQWLRGNATCPECRAAVHEEDDIRPADAVELVEVRRGVAVSAPAP